MSKPLNIIQKIWNQHLVCQEENAPAILYIDLQLLHEVTSPQAFSGLRQRGLMVRCPERHVATVDHSIPTLPSHDGTVAGRLSHCDELAYKQILMLEDNARHFGIRTYGAESDRNGICHVIFPELGFIQPGMTIVCGDSHTATHGAFGALAFGIGTSEVEHVFASQCLLQNEPKTYEVNFSGKLGAGVGAKDMILALIAKIGVSGGIGHVFEFKGEAIRSLNMEERMTLCNMSIEGGARAGLIAPDQTTFDYIADREFAPKGTAWDTALTHWKALVSDENAQYDQTITIDVSALEPMITFGTNPGMAIAVTETIPNPKDCVDLATRRSLEKALGYMGLEADKPIAGQKVDVVFIGSCTNSRLTDLRAAAKIMKGRHVADGVRVLVVPGSQGIKRIAEAEGIAKIFTDCGAQWREAGCSMCIAMNGDEISAGQYALSTSNRNFEGRQGKGGRTMLASPLTAAATAITGKVTDPRSFLEDQE